MRRAAVFAALVALTGCAGYHIGPVKPTYMRDVTSIAVPAFKNDTLEPRIEVLTAGTIIKQIQQDGTYRVASEDKADVVLQGTVEELRRRASRSVRGNVLATAEFTLTVQLRYKLMKRDTGAILREKSVTGSTSFFVGGDVQQDERQAIPLAVEDAAIRLVSEISEGW